MKKLMVAAVAMMLGVVAQAASCDWSTGEIYNFPGATGTAGDEDLATGYLVYFIDNATYDHDQAAADIAKGDLSFLAKKGDVQPTDGGYAGGSISGYGDGVTIEAYAVVLNANDESKATYAFISETASDSTGGKGQSASIWFDTAATQEGSNWQSVPEPTSGLLLLLGVAGLALRRRRA